MSRLVRRMRQAGWVALGTVTGLILVALGMMLYLRAVQVSQVRTAVSDQLRLPEEVLEVERIAAGGRVRIAVRNLAVLDAAGDTLVAAPVARMWFDAASLAGEGPVEFSGVELRRPFARLIRAPDGTWNLARAARVEADGRPVGEASEGRTLRFRDVRLIDGRLVLAIPATPPDSGTFAARLALPYVSRGRATYQEYSVRSLTARLPLVRFGGPRGWRVEVGSLAARVTEPDLRITGMQGWAQAAGEDGVEFSLAALRLGDSRISGAGTVRFAEAGPRFDVRLSADPLLLADVRGVVPTLPAEGTARFSLALESLADGRTRLGVSELELRALDSYLAGSLQLSVGGGAPLAFGPTQLTIDPLELEALATLGLTESLPWQGTLRGSISTTELVPEAEAGRLQVNLAARLVPRGQPDQPASLLVAVGPVAFGGADAPLRFEGVRLQAQPLHLEALASLAPERGDMLRGQLRGSAELFGTPRNLRLAGGELIYQVGSATPTRLNGLSGALVLDPALRYELRAEAQPLALATLKQLFPALPFRSATLSGPLRLEGNAETVRYSADLVGPAGGIRFAGSARLGDPLRFEVEGRVAAFTAGRLLQTELPVQGPVTGTFAARGTAEDLRFEVDLTQAQGRFALTGRVRRPGGPPTFEVAGEVTQFRLGTLLGQPGLFPAPVSGPVSLVGGGDQPYRYRVDLTGGGAVLDLAGELQPGAVPVYSARGRVVGLDLRRLPFARALPQTSLTGTIDLAARGRTLETLAGTLRLDARGSTVGGVPLDRARAQLAVEDGILRVEELELVMNRNRLSAEGMWGLQRPAPAPLRFVLNAPDLSTLSRVVASPQLIQPRLTGSLLAEGTVAGSVQHPELDVTLRGRRLRYETWQAGTLALEANVARTPTVGWGGELSLSGDAVVLGGRETLQSLRLQLSGTQAQLAVGLFARRDSNRDLALSGVLELEGRTPRAVALETLNLRVGEAGWRLVNPTRIRWNSQEGLEVRNLALQRTGEDGGWILVNGQVPPDGTADLRISAREVELSDVRQLWPAAPEASGRLTVDAVLSGPIGDPEMSLVARIDQFRYQGAEADRIALDAEYLDRRLEGRANLWLSGRPIATAEGSVPMRLTFTDFVPQVEMLRPEPLQAQVYADSLPLQLLAASVPTLRNGAGVASVQVQVGGTLDSPTLTGWGRIDGGAVEVEPFGVRYSDIRASLALIENRVRIDTLSMRSEGTLEVDGLVTFVTGGSPRLALTAELDNFRAMDVRESAQVTASGRVAVSGPLSEPVLTGRLMLEDANITVPDLDEPEGLEITDVEVGQIGPDPLPEYRLVPPVLAGLRIEALEVEAGESVWLVSNEARVQITGDLLVNRRADELQVFGTLQAVRGRYTLEIGSILREFEIVSGQVQFFGTPDINPALNIVAANRVRTSTSGAGGDLTVLVQITGTLRSPRLQLSSDTPVALSESELLSYLIFGRATFELGAQTRGLAEQLLVQEVLGGILATELERPFLAAGLCDYVRVRPGLATSIQGLVRFDPRSTLNAAAIECGLEVTNGLFATLETGIGALFQGEADGLNWGVGMEWQIDNEWLLEAQYGTVRRNLFSDLLNLDQNRSQGRRHQFSTDLRRRWEYGGSRRPTPLQTQPGARPADEAAPPSDPEPEPEAKTEPGAEPAPHPKKEEAPL